MRIPLNGIWNLTFTAPQDGQMKRMAAEVPGNVDIELEKNGFVEDCMPADDPRAMVEYEHVDDWTYTRVFDAPEIKADWTQELVFEGIDTIADVYLNGEKIHEARNMFLTHRIDVQGRLKPTHNELKVVIRSALLWARDQNYDIMSNSRGDTTWSGQPFLRKPRHAWGWDNAPRLLTSGLYRDVYLECLPPERFNEVYLYTERVTDETVWLGVIWNFKTPLADLQNYRVRWKLSFKGETLASNEMRVYFVRGGIHFTLPRSKVPLWWPLGFGTPNLCDFELELYYGDELRSSWQSQWGIRTLRLDRTEGIDLNNEGSFVFVVNNEKVYIHGTNWKPADALPSRSDSKVVQGLELAKDLNCNMIRIWGGGLYENDIFFDYCDQNGIMVWQDFMFAGEWPTRDEGYCKVVEEEAKQWIIKLRNHASLAVWCGDNEDDECLHWNNSETSILPSDNKVSREVLRECVIRYDPYRKYVESSPYISDTNWKERHAPDVVEWKTRHPKNVTQNMPEVHLYTPVMTVAKLLRESPARFIGETGPYYTCAVTENEDIYAREEPRLHRLWNQYQDRSLRNLRMHQTDDYLLSWLHTGRELCQAWFGRTFELNEWKDMRLGINIISSSVFKEIIEYCRIERWNKTGVLWWSLLDMWPMLFNYSVVDCYFGKKMPYYWIRQSQQPFALMVVRKEFNGEMALYAANDTLAVHKGTYRIISVSAAGEERMIASGSYEEPVNGCRLIQRLPETDEPELLILEWTENGQKNFNHFVTGLRPYDTEAWNGQTYSKDFDAGHLSIDLETWRKWTDRLKVLYDIES